MLTFSLILSRKNFIHFLPCFSPLLYHFNTLLYHFLHVLLYFVQHLPTQPNRYILPNFLPIIPKILPNRYNRYNPYFIIGLYILTQNKHLHQFPQTKNKDLQPFLKTKNNDLHPERQPAESVPKRMRRDSNPRNLTVKRFSRPSP